LFGGISACWVRCWACARWKWNCPTMTLLRQHNAESVFCWRTKEISSSAPVSSWP
jgi:hypothetical protein